MEKPTKVKTLIQFGLLVALILIASLFSTKLWGGKPETTPVEQALIFQEDMIIAEFGQKNHLPNSILNKVFNLETKQDLQKKVSDLNLTRAEISARVDKATALSEEYESKNWVKIPIKFGLWIIFLIIIFRLVRQGRINPRTRKFLYLIAIIIFGVMLGSDPSPMGTVKDAMALLGAKGVIFPPRMIALTIFLAMVFLANKFICGWGCQLGTLQDLIFRFARNPKDKKGAWQQYKIPFVLTNCIRIAFFAIFTVVAFLWAADIVEPIDPFKIYKPAMIGTMGGVFLGGLLVASLFVYRPWCHLFCPFGFAGWLVEKVSLFHIKVNYKTCISCETCAKTCPSTVMNAILKRDRVIPDCFACGTCIDACPTQSIKFAFGKGQKPPTDMFSGKGK